MVEKGFSGRSPLERLSEAVTLVTGATVLVTTLLITFDVLMRYFLNQPQLFVDELTSFFLVGIIFAGTGPTFYRGGHIRVDLLTNRLSPKNQRRLRILTLTIGLALLGIVIRETFVSTLSAYRMGRVSAVMLYPIWTAMLSVPIGLALMASFMAVSFYREWRGGEEEKREGPSAKPPGRSP